MSQPWRPMARLLGWLLILAWLPGGASSGSDNGAVVNVHTQPNSAAPAGPRLIDGPPAMAKAESQPWPAASLPGAASAPVRVQSSATTAPGQRPLKPDEIEVCGMGPVSKQSMGLAASGAPGSPDVEPSAEFLVKFEAQQVKAWQRILPAMAARGDVRSRAAVLVLGSALGQQVKSPATSSSASADAAALAQLALKSLDPVVISWALAKCHTITKTDSCGGLIARHWVQVEPANVLAWAALIQAEPGAVQEGLHHMARAQVADMHWGSVAAQVQASFSADLPPLMRLTAMTAAIGIEAAMIASGHTTISKLCSADALLDANRRQQCDDIATVLVDHGREFLSMSMGRGLGKRLGWSAERLQALSADIEALGQQAMVSHKVINEQPFSCASMDAMSQFIAGMARGGEVAWARRQLATAQPVLRKPAAMPLIDR